MPIEVRDSFQRALALCFLLAFCSFYAGSRELVGTRGIEPLRTIIEQRRVPGDLLESFSGTPTLLWLLDAAGVEAGAAADLLCLLGAALAAAACAPGALGGCTPLLVALSLFYLAVIAPLAATARGSSLPWAELSSDGLLLEAAFAAALWAPLWPRGREEEEEEEEEEEGGGGASEDSSGGSIGNTRASSTLSAPAHAPAFLLRWIVAKNAFFRGLCRWKRMKGSAATAAAAAVLSSSVSRSPPSPASALSLVALVADVALAPLALSPARLPRLVAAAALLASWAIDVAAAVAAAVSPFSLSSSKAMPLPLLSSHVPPLWTLLLRPALVLPLFHAGLLDSGGGSAGKAGEESSKAKRVARLLVSAAAAVPAFSSALGALSFSGSSSFEESLSKYAPLCLAAAGLTMLASLLADVLRSMSSASVGLFLEGEGEGGGETKKTSPPPMTLSMRRRREEQEAKRRAQHRSGQQQQQKVQYVRGTHEPALVGAISLMLFCAGCLEVSSSVASSSSPAGATAAAGGCSGGPGCGGGPAALVVARRLSWLARPWRATGPSFGSMMIEEEERGRGGAASSASVAIEVRSDCRGDDVDDTERGWKRVSPLSRSSRVAAALSSLSPRGEGEEDGESSSAPPPPWLDHLLYRLVSDPEGPVAASFAERQQQQTLPSAAPPCAARAVIVGGGGGGRTWASFSAAEAADASSPASERLARHGWGPLVEYESPSRFGRAVADAVALPRRVMRLGGFGGKEGGGGFSVLVAGAGAACSLALSAAALAVVRRGREGSPEAAAAAASKKRD